MRKQLIKDLRGAYILLGTLITDLVKDRYIGAINRWLDGHAAAPLHGIVSGLVNRPFILTITGAAAFAVVLVVHAAVVSRASKPSANGISAKFLRAHLIPNHPFAGFVKDIYRAAQREDYISESDFLFEIYLVNKGVPVTIQKITCEAERDGKWEALPLVDNLDDYQLRFPDQLIDNPSWIGGKTAKVLDLEPNLANELKGKVLEKGVGYRGWLRFAIKLTNAESGKPVNNRVSFIDALDIAHPVLLPDPLPTDGEIIHNLKTWRERLRRS
jgi:hypothetical protein